MADMDTHERAMVVVAHPDDAEWGCSGTVALWCREGVEVVYVICTDGSKGASDPDITSEGLAKMRREEQLAAAKVLGVKEVVSLDYEDAMLQPTLELRRDIVRQIRRFRPDVVVTTSPTRELDEARYIGHPDHMAAGEATLSAVFPAARDRLTFPELLKEGLPPHKVREVRIIMYSGPGVNRWVDITQTIDVSVRALQQHRSQTPGEEADRERRRERADAGRRRGVAYAEEFRSFMLD